MDRTHHRKLRSLRQGSATPFFGLVILWFAIEYLRPQDYLPALGLLRPGFVLLLVIGVVWLIKGDKWPLHDNLTRLFILFIAVGSLSIFSARNNYWVFHNNIALISYLVGGVLPFAAFANKPDALRRFFLLWVVVHGFIAAAGIVRGGTGSGSFMGDENDLAITMAMAIPFAYFLAFTVKQPPWMRILLVVAGLLMIAAVVASRSRGGFLGMTAAALAVVWFSQNRIRNLLLVAVVAMGVFYGVSDAYKEEMSSIANTQDKTRLSRIYFWNRGLEMFADNPLFGVGSGNYGWVIEDYELRDQNFDPERARSGGRVPHSLYFTVIPEYGLVGTALFAALVAGLWWRLGQVRTILRQTRTEHADVLIALSRAMHGSLLAFLVSGAFLSVLYYPHFWYLIGFGIACHFSALRLRACGIALPPPRHARPLNARA